jgi:cysteine-rich repeat protein
VALAREPATGALTVVGVRRHDVAGAQKLAISADGRSLYVSLANAVVALQRTGADGTLEWVSTLSGVTGLVLLDPGGLRAWARDATPASTVTLVSLDRDSATGALVAAARAGVPGDPLALSPDGTSLYAQAFGPRGEELRVYRTDVGGPTLVQAYILRDAGSVSPASATFSPDGRSLYVSNNGANHPVLVFVREPADGRLTLAQRLPATPGGGGALIVTPEGGAVIAGLPLRVLRRDPATSRLDPIDGGVVSDAGSAGGLMVTSPDGRDVYATTSLRGDLLHLRRTCGDGVVAPGEVCDDGSRTDGDGCSAACTVEPCWSCSGQPSGCDASDGTTCNDGNPCTAGERCAAGVCGSGTPVPDGGSCDNDDACSTGDACVAGTCVAGAPLACGPCDSCDRDTGCAGAPIARCSGSFVTSPTGRIMITREGSARAALQWRFDKRYGAGGMPSFPDPRTNDYTLCVFGGGEGPALMSARLPAGSLCGGRDCWTTGANGGFSFHDPKAVAAVGRVDLLAPSPRRRRIALGGRLPLDGSMPLSLESPPEVELRGGGLCWGTHFGLFVHRNDRHAFAARGGDCPRSGCGGEP